MTAYVDTSVILRIVLTQPDRLAQWAQIGVAVTSSLTEVECLRSLDRRFRQGLVEPADFAERRALVFKLLDAMERVDVSAAVLRRAADPFPTPLGTLDAIHLSTALLWAQGRSEPLVFATHDAQLAAGATSVGFSVVGFSVVGFSTIGV